MKQKFGGRTLPRKVFAKELKTALGLSWQKRAHVEQDAPASVRETPGFGMPTLAQFERLVQEKSGTASC